MSFFLRDLHLFGDHVNIRGGNLERGFHTGRSVKGGENATVARKRRCALSQLSWSWKMEEVCATKLPWNRQPWLKFEDVRTVPDGSSNVDKPWQYCCLCVALVNNGTGSIRPHEKQCPRDRSQRTRFSFIYHTTTIVSPLKYSTSHSERMVEKLSSLAMICC